MRLTTLAASLAAVMLLGPTLARAGETSNSAPAPKPATPAAPAKPAMPAPAAAAAAPAAAAEPERITIQHVLIGFQGSVPGKNITRTLEEAKTLAGDILKRASGGEDFDALVKQYTDDSHPGIYTLVNNGLVPGQGEWARRRMVPAFGDTGFPLKVGEVGVAEYDRMRSPYGWHVVKRLK